MPVLIDSSKSYCKKSIVHREGGGEGLGGGLGGGDGGGGDGGGGDGGGGEGASKAITSLEAAG